MDAEKIKEYESHGLRPLTEAEKFTTDVKDWRGVVERGKKGPKHRRSCDQTIYQGRATYPCGRDADWMDKDASTRKHFCRQHATGKVKQRKNDAARRAEETEKRDTEKATKARVIALSKALGIGVRMDFLPYPTSKYSSTTAVVDLDDLEALARRLNEKGL